jgi:hypothetical protein
VEQLEAEKKKYVVILMEKERVLLMVCQVFESMYGSNGSLISMGTRLIGPTDKAGEVK